MAAPTHKKSSPTPSPAGAPDEPPHLGISWKMLMLLLAMLAAMYMWRASSERSSRPELDYSTFYQMVSDGKVASVRFRGQAIEGEFASPTTVNDQSVEKFRSYAPTRDDELLPLLRDRRVEIEVDTLEQLNGVLALGVEAVLLDNMSNDELTQAVALSEGRNTVLEASGRMSLDRVGSVAATGVDLISVGALTHSTPILDLGLDFESL